MLALLFSVISVARAVAHEKEKGLKIALQMMGMPNWMHWAAWFLIQFAGLFLAIVPVTIELADGDVLPHCETGLLFVYFVLYAMSAISFSFFVSAFFSKASSAAAAAGIAWFLSYFPYFFIYPRYAETSTALKTLVSLMPNTGMALGATIIALKEASSDGVTWDNYGDTIDGTDTFSFRTVLWMLFFDTVAYMMLAIYVDNCNPGPFGIPRKWTYPIAGLLAFFGPKITRLRHQLKLVAGNSEERVSLLAPPSGGQVSASVPNAAFNRAGRRPTSGGGNYRMSKHGANESR